MGIEAIVVGIPNMGRRRRYEYSPFHDPVHGGGGGDRYLRFLCETLKPRIDAAFPTLRDRQSTAVAGSSLGGLISLYALFRRPETFGVAGALSPALWFAGGAIFDYLRRAPAPGGRIYLDIGTAEGDDELREARQLRDLLVERGIDRVTAWSTWRTKAPTTTREPGLGASARRCHTWWPDAMPARPRRVPMWRREHAAWDSPALAGRRMDVLIYGHGGARVLVFPTSQGVLHEWEDFGMVGALAELSIAAGSALLRG